MKKTIYILGGGTFSHVRNHMSIAAPAFGETAIRISKLMAEEVSTSGISEKYNVKLVLTKMADRTSPLVTNDDVKAYVKQLVDDPTTACIVFNVALVDYDGTIGDVPSSKYATRLESREGTQQITLTPSEKIIGMIRKTRKDVFAVGFKTTCHADGAVQYSKGMRLMKDNSLNLVLANDTGTRLNMVIAPEESRYAVTTDRGEALSMLVKMTVSRMQNRFTRSTVVPGDSVDWNGELVPENLRVVVNSCIENGAYKPFQGKTVGHFAVKHNDGVIFTSKRKTNFNLLPEVGLVKIESTGEDSVIAYGAKPSVGGQSQRIIFKEHSDVDCIVHFHCPVRQDAANDIPVKEQWPNECGSHECGKQTSSGLRVFDLGDGQFLKAVYLKDHGPNIVFSRDVDPMKVINFIKSNFVLSDKTGGLLNDIQLSQM